MRGSQARARGLVVRPLVRLALLLAAGPALAGILPPTGSIRGSVLEAAAGRPVASLRVELHPDDLEDATRADEAFRFAITDGDGVFRFGELEPGTYRLRIEGAGVGSRSITGLRVGAGETTLLDPLTVVSWSERLTVRAASEPSGGRGLSHLHLSRSALDDRPASLQDPLRTLAGAAGIGTQNDFKADLRIRGGDAADTAVLSDGLPLLRAYHFSGSAGSVSSLDDGLVQEIDVWNGGFSAEYGDALAGVVEIASRDARPANFTGEAGLGTALAHTTLRGPLGEGSWTLSGRASDLRLYTDRTDEKKVLGVTFHDLLAGFDFALPGSGRLGLTLQEGASGFEQALGLDEHASLQGAEHAARLRLELPVDDRTFCRILAGHGLLESGSTLGSEAYYNQTEWRDDFRASVLRLLGTRHALSAGFDLTRTGNRIAGTIDQGDLLSSAIIDGPATTTGAFLEDLWRPTGTLSLRAGGRLDRFSVTGESAFSPRLGLEVRPGGGFLLRASAGRFVQFPRPEQLFLAAGGEPLTRQQADHFIVGVERSWERGPRMLIEIYRKDLKDPIAETVNLYTDLPETLARFERGRVRGIDLTVESAEGSAWRLRFDASYLVAREEKDGRWYASNTDQRYNLALNAGHRLGRGWDLSGTLRYASGLPYTREDPWVSGAQVGTRLGQLNGARLPIYNRLDLRFTRSIPVSWGRLRLAVDLLNVYDRRNVRSIELAYDESVPMFYRISRGQSPFLPVFALTAEF